MNTFKNEHDVVERNLMMSRDVASYTDVTRRAKTDLDNGRLVVRDGEFYTYPKDAKSEEIFLVTTPEKTYEDVGLDKFYNKKGNLIRVDRVALGCIFSTTAVADMKNLKVGDKVIVNKDGKLVKGAVGGAVFEVKAKVLLGKEMGVTVERIFVETTGGASTVSTK